MAVDRVREYYAGFAEREGSRLDTPSGSLEFAVNSHFIGQYLPADSRVLDIGGGPGRYALWLAGLGHRVVLADLSPELLAIAKDRVATSSSGSLVEDIAEADARDLSAWGDHEFDAALSLGPFYHLPRPEDRGRAASELHRVVRPDGIIFVALMPRYALVRRTAAIPAESHRLLDEQFLSDLTNRGIFFNDAQGRFDSGYGVIPGEIAPYFESHGFESLGLVASEGLGSGIEEAVNRLANENRDAHDKLMELILDSAADPILHGLTTHLLYIGRRT